MLLLSMAVKLAHCLIKLIMILSGLRTHFLVVSFTSDIKKIEYHEKCNSFHQSFKFNIF